MNTDTAAITTGHISYNDGFEFYTFQIGVHGFDYLSRAREPLAVLAGWYLTDPRPAASEIVGISDITPNEAERMFRITLKIKRGHYKLSEFITRHLTHATRLWTHDDRVELYCDKCEENEFIYKESIPAYVNNEPSVTE